MKIFFHFFLEGITIAGSAQKNRVVPVSGNTGFFLGLTILEYVGFEVVIDPVSPSGGVLEGMIF